jgi:hypothetical protein
LSRSWPISYNEIGYNEIGALRRTGHKMISSKMRRLAAMGFASAMAVAAPGHAKPPPAKALVCKGQKMHLERALQTRAAAESMTFYTYATKTFGQPTSCSMTWETFEENLFPTIVYDFSGATYTVASLPPETGRTELIAKDGFPDEKVAKALLEKQLKADNWEVDWSKPNIEKSAAKDGLSTTTYWSPEDGANMGVDLVYRGKRLIGIATHFAM